MCVCSRPWQALLCKDPLSGYREAMRNKVPEDIVNEIIVHFVGPEGARVNSYGKVSYQSAHSIPLLHTYMCTCTYIHPVRKL